jgi:hypothetical protein
MEYDIDFFGSEQYFLTHNSVVWIVKVVFFYELRIRNYELQSNSNDYISSYKIKKLLILKKLMLMCLSFCPDETIVSCGRTDRFMRTNRLVHAVGSEPLYLLVLPRVKKRF